MGTRPCCSITHTLTSPRPLETHGHSGRRHPAPRRLQPPPPMSDADDATRATADATTIASQVIGAGAADGRDMVCRICYEGPREEDKLFSPCLCRGSCKYVHVSCLHTWRHQVRPQPAPSIVFPAKRKLVVITWRGLCSRTRSTTRTTAIIWNATSATTSTRSERGYPQLAAFIRVDMAYLRAYSQLCRPFISRILLSPHLLLVASGTATALLALVFGSLVTKLGHVAHWYVGWRNPSLAAGQVRCQSKTAYPSLTAPAASAPAATPRQQAETARRCHWPSGRRWRT
jgi:hypothetical protein